MIGQTLAGSPHGDDGVWPHPAVRELIEETGSKELETGVEIGVYNSRGVVSRQLDEVVYKNASLPKKYAGFAVTTKERWPRTAAMLRRIADEYRRQGRREDQDAELHEDLGG